MDEKLETIEYQKLLKKNLLGSSTAINQIRESLLLYSSLDKPVLLLGETGTGKSHIAHLIHILSGRMSWTPKTGQANKVEKRPAVSQHGGMALCPV